jgi:replication-associated recombination protein RarA
MPALLIPYTVLLRIQQSSMGIGALKMRLRPHLVEAQSVICASLQKTVREGSNNSLLVIGPPGSGKTEV